MLKNKIYFPLIIGIAVAIGIFLGSKLNYKNKTFIFTKNSKETKLKKLLNYIEYDYVDKVNTDSLLDHTITHMLAKLDPHSVYIPKEDLQQVTENMKGKFVGIGISFRVYKDSVTVINVIENGPAKKAGIQDGDRILMANKDTLYGKTLLKNAKVKKEDNEFLKYKKTTDFIIKNLKGLANTNVNIATYRPSKKETLNLNVIRGEVPIKSISAYYKLTPNLGYIKINRFARTTYKEFKKALDSLINNNTTSLAIDLRGNTGGFMDIANKIVDEFLEKDKLIVFTKDKNGVIESTFATKKGNFEKGNLYILIDRNSASASEIVAGAIQDNDRGTVVGRRSFGKGLVQQEMGLGDGSAVRLTTSRYYTPTGRSIQKPYKNTTSENYENDTYHRFVDGELTNKDSIKVNEKLKFTTPKGKIVYGGGGIIPDIFVAIDTTVFQHHSNIYSKLSDFVFNYIDTHRNKLKKYTLQDFKENFDKNNTILNQYIAQLKLKKPLNKAQKEELKTYFKAYTARNLFNDLGFYYIVNQKDPVIKKVIELEKQK